MDHHPNKPLNSEEGLKRVRKVIALEGQISCRVCGEAILGPCVLCSTCETPHHGDCWSYGGGCSVYGCKKSEPVTVTLPEKELEALRREVERRRRQIRLWQGVTVGVSLLAGVMGFYWWFRGIAPEALVVAQARTVDVTPRPVAPPTPSPSTASPVATPTGHTDPVPRPAACALDLDYISGTPTSPAEAVGSAWPEGPGELKMVTVGLTPVGAYAVTIPLDQAEALRVHRSYLSLAPGADPDLPQQSWKAREVLETWTYRGRDTPLPAARTNPLPSAGNMVWEITELTRSALSSGSHHVDALLIPGSMDFQVARAMQRMETSAAAWLSFGSAQETPPAPRLRARPDLVISSMVHRPPWVEVEFENRGTTTSPFTFDMSLMMDGRGVLGCSDSPLEVPPPSGRGIAKFAINDLARLNLPDFNGLWSAEIDWADHVPESDESNNIMSRNLQLGPLVWKNDSRDP